MSAITLHPATLLLYPIFSPLRLLRSAMTSVLAILLDALVFLAVLYALLHRTGILKRIVRQFAEYQLSKVSLLDLIPGVFELIYCNFNCPCSISPTHLLVFSSTPHHQTGGQRCAIHTGRY